MEGRDGLEKGRELSQIDPGIFLPYVFILLIHIAIKINSKTIYLIGIIMYL